MRNNRRLSVCCRVLAVAMLCALPTACTQLRGPLFTPNGDGPEWPMPPEAPRIRYIGELRGADDMKPEVGGFARFIATIFGESETIELIAPRSVVHPSGTDVVWIGDPGAHCLHRFNLKNNSYLQVTSLLGSEIHSPVALSEGPDGGILVCDSVTGSVVLIDVNSGVPIREIPIPADILRPVGIAYDPASSRIFVVDAVAHDVKVLDIRGRLVNTIGRRGEAGGEMNFPSAISWDGELLWISDSGNHRVQGLKPTGEFVVSIGQPGDASGDMALPKSVGIDSKGHVYVVDARFENIQVFTRDGQLLMAFGEEGSAPGQFWLPGAIFIDDDDWLWVCDPYNKRVQVFRYLQDRATKEDEN